MNMKRELGNRKSSIVAASLTHAGRQTTRHGTQLLPLWLPALRMDGKNLFLNPPCPLTYSYWATAKLAD
jgi:hypothetical protein